jgi:TRAP-type C4-dicarboxylate transport system permease small subunit
MAKMEIVDSPRREMSTGLLGWYESAMRFIAGSTMAVIVAIMIVQVIARYVFNASLIWAEELCRYILIWQTFLLIGIAYQYGELVILDLLRSRLSPLVHLLVRIVVAVPVGFFLYLMTVHGLANALRYTAQTVPAVDFIWTSLFGVPASLPIFWVYVAVPVGCAILLAHYVGHILYDLYTVVAGTAGGAKSNQA